MAKVKAVKSSEVTKRLRPATTPEGRENQLIALATDLVEQRLMDGTASSQETTHFLKLASSKYRYETEKLKKENQLLEAKTKALESAEESKVVYEKVLKAISIYSGRGEPDDY